MKGRAPLTPGELADFCAALVETTRELGQLLGDATQRAPEGAGPLLKSAQQAARAFYQAMAQLQQQAAQLPQAQPPQPGDLPGYLH